MGRSVGAEIRGERKEPGPKGAVKIGAPDETERPTFEVEEVGKRNSGDVTYQAVLNIKGQGGRVRAIRAPPRTSKDTARKDGEDMVDCFVDKGMDGIRSLQQEMRRT